MNSSKSVLVFCVMNSNLCFPHMLCVCVLPPWRQDKLDERQMPEKNKRHLTAEGHAGLSLHDSLKSTLSPASPTQSRWPVGRPPLPFWGGVEALSFSFFAPIMYYNSALGTYEKWSLHQPFPWEHAEHYYSSLTAEAVWETVCLLARGCVITRTYKVFLSTFGQCFPNPHLQMHMYALA